MSNDPANAVERTEYVSPVCNALSGTTMPLTGSTSTPTPVTCRARYSAGSHGLCSSAPASIRNT